MSSASANGGDVARIVKRTAGRAPSRSTIYQALGGKHFPEPGTLTAIVDACRIAALENKAGGDGGRFDRQLWLNRRHRIAIGVDTEDSSDAGTSSGSTDSKGYSWEVFHDGMSVWVGTGALGKPDSHLIKLHIHRDTFFSYEELALAIYSEQFFEVPGEYELARLRAILDGKPEPKPVSVLRVVVRDAKGVTLRALQAEFTYKPVTDEQLVAFAKDQQRENDLERRALDRKVQRYAQFIGDDDADGLP